MPQESPTEYTSSLRDSVLENSSIIEDLSPEAAEFFMDWAVSLSEHVGATVTDEEHFNSTKRSLMRMLRVINAYINRRDETDEESLHILLEKLNKFATDLALPAIDAETEASLRQNAGADDLTFGQQLAETLLPPPAPITEDTATDAALGDETSPAVDTNPLVADAKNVMDQLESMARRLADELPSEPDVTDSIDDAVTPDTDPLSGDTN